MTADELAAALFAAIERHDVEATTHLYAPGAVIWHNTDSVEQTVDENTRTLGWVVDHLPDTHYEETRRSITSTGFVQQHVLVATNRRGDIVRVPACIVGTVADGAITRLDEYLDSAAVAELTARPDRPAP